MIVSIYDYDVDDDINPNFNVISKARKLISGMVYKDNIAISKIGNSRFYFLGKDLRTRKKVWEVVKNVGTILAQAGLEATSQFAPGSLSGATRGLVDGVIGTLQNQITANSEASPWAEAIISASSDIMSEHNAKKGSDEADQNAPSWYKAGGGYENKSNKNDNWKIVDNKLYYVENN